MGDLPDAFQQDARKQTPEKGRKVGGGGGVGKKKKLNKTEGDRETNTGRPIRIKYEEKNDIAARTLAIFVKVTKCYLSTLFYTSFQD